VRYNAVSESDALNTFVGFDLDKDNVHFIEMPDGIMHIAMDWNLVKIGADF
jgi:hypothetical protein